MGQLSYFDYVAGGLERQAREKENNMFQDKKQAADYVKTQTDNHDVGGIMYYLANKALNKSDSGFKTENNNAFTIDSDKEYTEKVRDYLAENKNISGIRYALVTEALEKDGAEVDGR